MKLKLESPVDEAPGIGKTYREILNQRGILTVFDLLLHFPVDYIDPSRVYQRPIQSPDPNLFLIVPHRQYLRRNYARRLSILRVDARLGGRPVQLVFFNQPYLQKQIPIGKPVYIYGSFQIRDQRWESINPRIIHPESDQHIIAVYPSLGFLKTGRLRSIFHRVLARLSESEAERFPPIIQEKYQVQNPVAVLRTIHEPRGKDLEMIAELREIFIYREFLMYYLKTGYFRRRFSRRKRKFIYRINRGTLEAVNQALSFALTEEQVKAFEEVVRDLKGPHSMQRILMGDVGVGKTVIAFLGLLLAVQNGYQGAFLAPTEVLADQQFTAARRFFPSRSLALLTGSTPLGLRKKTEKLVRSGEVDIIFGTHALLHAGLEFQNLSIVIIDEQHRFGVSQRTRMVCKGRGVDLLVTTATPIPRTLLFSMYRDLAVSIIRQKPNPAPPAVTRRIEYPRRAAFYDELADRFRRGKQKAYVVVPLIEESEYFSDLCSLENQRDFYQGKFHGISAGFLTGRDSSEHKTRILRDLKRGEIRILICTTVIEVGIDIRDVNTIVIENADRYGLSQLHQLRGRVGRGGKKSYCYLLASPASTPAGRRRLEIISRTHSGFDIAEQDLAMRGGGIITGYRQSGFTDFRLGDPRRDIRVFTAARRDAEKIQKDAGDSASPWLKNKKIQWEKEWKDVGIS